MMWKGYTACFASILCYHVLTWSASSLSVVTDSPSPIVVVLSGSMEPAFQRGDLLFLCTDPPSPPACLEPSLPRIIGYTQG